jgi:hypothetical protein
MNDKERIEKLEKENKELFKMLYKANELLKIVKDKKNYEDTLKQNDLLCKANNKMGLIFDRLYRIVKDNSKLDMDTIRELNKLYTAYLCLAEHIEDYADMDFLSFMQSMDCEEDYLVY